MKHIFKLLILAILLTSCTQKSKFTGTWYNNTNFCDSIMVKSGENKLVFEYANSKYPAEEKDGYLEIYSEKTLKGALGDEDELLIKGIVFAKKPKDFNLNGEWKIFECSEKFEWSGLSVENDTVTISYGAPIQIIATANKIHNDTIALKYQYGAGTISMMNIVDEVREKIDYEKPIGYIIPKSKNHFNFIWNGVTIKGQEEKWLSYLDDDVYWGEKAQDFEYNIIFARE